MTESKIEWTGRSDWNPVRGCTRASQGCGGPAGAGGCYAEKIAARFSDPGQAFHGYAERTPNGGRWTGKVDLMEDRLTIPLRWRKPATVFVNSSSDIFHEALPDEAIDRIFAVMALAPQHTFQVLTKRADRMRDYLAHRWTGFRIRDRMQEIAPQPVIHMTSPLPNVWLGVSVEDQPAAEARIPYLLDTPAAVRFLSCEPLLGPIDLTRIRDEVVFPGHHVSALTGWGGFDYPRLGPQSGLPNVHWVIAGGESGPRSRPMHPQWVRSIRDQCREAQVPFFFKQWGEWGPAAQAPSGTPGRYAVATAAAGASEMWPQSCVPADSYPRQFDLFGGAQVLELIGKRAAGRLLDGQTHDETPHRLNPPHSPAAGKAIGRGEMEG